MALINWVHVFGVAPLLTYIVVKNSNKEVLSDDWLSFLTLLIVMMVIFHLYKGVYGKECTQT